MIDIDEDSFIGFAMTQIAVVNRAIELSIKHLETDAKAGFSLNPHVPESWAKLLYIEASHLPIDKFMVDNGWKQTKTGFTIVANEDTIVVKTLKDLILANRFFIDKLAGGKDDHWASYFKEESFNRGYETGFWDGVEKQKTGQSCFDCKRLKTVPDEDGTVDKEWGCWCCEGGICSLCPPTMWCRDIEPGEPPNATPPKEECVYLVHETAYESQCDEYDEVSIFTSLDEARSYLNEKASGFDGLHMKEFKRSENEFSAVSANGTWFYRTWIETVPIKHHQKEEKNHDSRNNNSEIV